MNLPGIAGLYAGMRVALAHMRESHERTIALCDFMREELLNMPGVRVYTPAGAPILSLNVEGIGSQELAGVLDADGIAVRGGLHCAPGVHRFLGTLDTGAVRVSPGLYSTRADVSGLLKCIRGMTK